MGQTEIEWAEFSHNPGIYGCEVVSPACAHCYAARMAHRQVAMGHYPRGITRATRRAGVTWTGNVQVAGEPSLDGLPKKKRARVFVSSMTDIFHPAVPFEWLAKLFELMREASHLEFLVLTKRAERMAEFNTRMLAQGYAYPRTPRHCHWWWPENVWAGVTAEDQKRANERIPYLLEIDARRLVSMEPLLGPVDLRRIPRDYDGVTMDFDALSGRWHADSDGFDPGWTDERLQWVIVGGESGPGARPSHPDWFRDIRDACALADLVPFMFKQWGEWRPAVRGQKYPPRTRSVMLRRDGSDIGECEEFDPVAGNVTMVRIGKKVAGRILDGHCHNDIPPFLVTP